MTFNEDEILNNQDIDVSLVENKLVEYTETPMQLIEFVGSQFKVNQQALEIISSIEDEIIVVAVVGKARTGKSYIMNLLLDNIGKNKGVN